MKGIITGVIIMLLATLSLDASGTVPAVLVLTGATITGISWLKYRDLSRKEKE